eukprot:CAMPEP_0170548606 /NCGR_PEP_ID=MMETSP0211-20121228/6875_1 /TAXON_ID=311385 /ORGANISM="Pseudokeronopsis sp., Strain OXSARD2" /LENGTH=225 /DNA_ID=CAMNT_0010854217 /DNA_START=1024 /DNA_END=1701 /DNA_ORIENTATION=+
MRNTDLNVGMGNDLKSTFNMSIIVAKSQNKLKKNNSSMALDFNFDDILEKRGEEEEKPSQEEQEKEKEKEKKKKEELPQLRLVKLRKQKSESNVLARQFNLKKRDISIDSNDVSDGGGGTKIFDEKEVLEEDDETSSEDQSYHRIVKYQRHVGDTLNIKIWKPQFNPTGNGMKEEEEKKGLAYSPKTGNEKGAYSNFELEVVLESEIEKIVQRYSNRISKIFKNF